MKQINYNRSAELMREHQFGICKDVESPCSMGALVQLGTSRLCKEFRQIELPQESVHNFRGFFISAVLQTKPRTADRLRGRKDRNIRNVQTGRVGYSQNTHERVIKRVTMLGYGSSVDRQIGPLNTGRLAESNECRTGKKERVVDRLLLTCL